MGCIMQQSAWKVMMLLLQKFCSPPVQLPAIGSNSMDFPAPSAEALETESNQA